MPTELLFCTSSASGKERIETKDNPSGQPEVILMSLMIMLA
jgi:hypothetical protein